jgi:xanthine dehydrogenase accessory factor
MRDVLAPLLAWCRDGAAVGVATVVSTSGSTPLPVGATMLVGPGGAAYGSVSGGCVEADVHAVASEVIATGVPALRSYGIADDEAMGVGLTCGGTLDVFVHRLTYSDLPELEELAAAVAADRPFVVATVVEHPDAALVGRRLVVRRDPSGNAPVEAPFGADEMGIRLRYTVDADAVGMLVSGSSGTLSYGPAGERQGTSARVLYEVSAPQPRLIVFGAVDFAAALAATASLLGYRVTVCDARPAFATPERFPGADEVVVDWPDRYLAAEIAGGRVGPDTALAVLTHDPKFDVPVLVMALRDADVGYVGAMGSRRTHDLREVRLREHGLGDADLAGLHSPIGLDLGARTPQETAVSIVAEMIAHRWGGSGRPLGSVATPVHAPSPSLSAPVARSPHSTRSAP